MSSIALGDESIKNKLVGNHIPVWSGFAPISRGPSKIPDTPSLTPFQSIGGPSNQANIDEWNPSNIFGGTGLGGYPFTYN